MRGREGGNGVEEGLGGGVGRRASTLAPGARRTACQPTLHPPPTNPTLPLRRKQREARKYSKEVQTARRQEKAASKKAAVAGVDALRRDRARKGYAGNLDADAALAAMEGRGGGVAARLGQRVREGERGVEGSRSAGEG